MDLVFLGHNRQWDTSQMTEDDILRLVREYVQTSAAYGPPLALDPDAATNQTVAMNALASSGLSCIMMPLSINFTQRPGTNAAILDELAHENRVVAETRRLWKLTDTINFKFLNGSDEDKRIFKEVVSNRIQPHVSMKFTFEGSKGVTQNVEFKTSMPNNVKGIGCVGKQTAPCLDGKAHLQLHSGFMKTNSFYLIAHEVGHLLSLYHEFQQDLCNQAGVVCTGNDPQSVMNYNINPPDYTEKDKAWLKATYKGSGTTGTQGPTTTPTSTTARPSTTAPGTTSGTSGTTSGTVSGKTPPQEPDGLFAFLDTFIFRLCALFE